MSVVIWFTLMLISTSHVLYSAECLVSVFAFVGIVAPCFAILVLFPTLCILCISRIINRVCKAKHPILLQKPDKDAVRLVFIHTWSGSWWVK